MKLRKLILGCVLVGLLGCASNPDRIDASYVSPLKYADYTCGQIGREMAYVGERTNDLYQLLKRERTGDTWQAGVGLVLFWPALLALEGGDGPNAAEYAQLKGDFEALRVNSVQKDCNLNYESPDQLIEAATEADYQTASVRSNQTIAEELQELESLKTDGLISQGEYDLIRARILGIED